MIKIIPKDRKPAEVQNYILGSVAPRPICFASTIDKNGNVNLSPFSFFNAFSSNPPILVFSSARRVRDNTTKHTLQNILDTKEVVVNMVTYALVQQTSLTSTEYPKGVSEFVKAGLTPVASEMVKPPRVKESPVHYECKVNQVIECGTHGGAGNLIICEALLIHIDEKILDVNGKIDPDKIDLVARMGGNFYCRASGDALFEVEKPVTRLGIGVDKIPERIRSIKILTGNNLGQLGNVETLPSKEEVEAFKNEKMVHEILVKFENDKEEQRNFLHLLAKDLLDKGNVADAWKVLLIGE